MSKLFMLSSVVYRSFLRHRFCVPGKDLNWFTDKEIENNVSEFCVTCKMQCNTNYMGEVNHSNPSSGD